MERKLTIRSPFNVFDGEQSQEERFSILKDTLQSRLALSLSLGHDVGLSTCAVVKLPLIRSRSPPSSTSSSSSSSSSPTSPSYHDPAESIRSIPSYHQHQNSASLTLLVTSSASSLSHLTRSARLPSLPAHLSLSLSLPILALSLLLSSPSQLVQPSPVHISVALQPLIGGSFSSTRLLTRDRPGIGTREFGQEATKTESPRSTIIIDRLVIRPTLKTRPTEKAHHPLLSRDVSSIIKTNPFIFLLKLRHVERMYAASAVYYIAVGSSQNKSVSPPTNGTWSPIDASPITYRFAHRHSTLPRPLG
ncbi:hypothetical protein PGT21_014592 [Puccinia graminis f. sp. tritici]|uniref:Uncharacterized protein n=1 Tax=Puccinia graminis f. sp. tritici TaxID=56615 RepID=A0A5B0N0U2_PUCGR|nr:hypothetical protein PGT21_014592 [Puccinia graminis f. sp. tritici]